MGRKCNVLRWFIYWSVHLPFSEKVLTPHLPLAAYMFSIVIYFTVTVPGLRTIVLTPANAEEVRDKLEALRVLCAGNNLIALCLIGVLCLQVRLYGSLIAAC